MRRFSFTIMLCLGLGCSLDRQGKGTDASVDALVDDPDAPITCSDPGAQRCSGNTREVCSPIGELTRSSCGDATCVELGGSATCEVGARCTAGATRCDGGVENRCNQTGVGETSRLCVAGCNPLDGRCYGAVGDLCSLLSEPGQYTSRTIAAGEYRFSTCDGMRRFSWQSAPVAANNCDTGNGVLGRDRYYFVNVPTGERLRVRLIDDDDNERVNPLVYLQRTCNQGSQITCGNDVPCATSDITDQCRNDWQFRDARFVTDAISSGTYVLVVDGIEGQGDDCGTVRLTLSFEPAV